MTEITEEDHNTIQEIMDSMKCPKGFECAENGFKNLCKVRDFGDEQSLQCLEQTSPPCPLAGVYNDGFQMHFCRCPLRVYVAKNLGK